MSAELHPKIPIMLIQGAECTAVSTTAAVFPVPFIRCEVLDFFVTLRGSSAHTTKPVFQLDIRPTAGLTTSQATLAHVTASTTLAQGGKVLYDTTLHTTRLTATMGGEFVLRVLTSAGESLLYDAAMVIREVPEVPANNTNLTSA